MRPTIVHPTQNAALAGHPEERRLYDILTSEYYWPNMSTDVYDELQQREDIPWIGTKFKQRLHLQLFSPRGRLEIIAFDNFGMLPQTESDNKFVAIINDWYGKLTRNTPK